MSKFFLLSYQLLFEQNRYDPWLSQLDWSTKSFCLSKKSNETKVKDTEKLNANFSRIIKSKINQNLFYKNSSQKLKNEVNTIYLF